MPKQPPRVNRTARWLAIVLVASVASARTARAAEPAEPAEVAEPAGAARAVAPDAPEAPQPPQTSWYGWQTLAADAGAIGLMSLGFVVDDAKYGVDWTQRHNYELGANVLFVSSFAAYTFGGPAVHWAHGHGRKGLASLGLRVGAPLGGMLAGLLLGAASCSGGFDDGDFVPCPVAFGAIGFLAGAVAAPIVDAAVLAREPVTPPAAPLFQAAFVPSGGGGKLVLAGRF